MHLLKFLISKTFWLNLLIAIAIFVIGILIFFQWLETFTNHNESLTVPEFEGLSLKEAEKLIHEKNLRDTVVDSVYMPNMPSLAVVEQNPPPLAKVKRNRKIYFTVNSPEPPKIKLPELEDQTLRNAKLILKSRGLTIGDVEYKPDISNTILEIRYHGRRVYPGDNIPKGAALDLLIGDQGMSQKVQIQNLMGMTLEDVKFLFAATGLNIGATVYDETVKTNQDTTESRIYKQYPPYKPKEEISEGEAVDLYFTSKENFENKYAAKLDSLLELQTDTSSDEQF